MSEDPLRTFTGAEKERLTLNLRDILDEVHRGAMRGRVPAVDLICDLHRRLFRGVRDQYAGELRRQGFGSDRLRFGPNWSFLKEQVLAGLQERARRFGDSLASFEANQEAPDYEDEGIRACVWFHAEIIRVHPFEDGNGRTSRILLNWGLVRLGLRPIAHELPREEYYALLNHYFATPSGDLRPLVDLYLRLYPLPNSPDPLAAIAPPPLPPTS